MYLSLPDILSIDIFKLFNCCSISLLIEFSPPIRYTFLAPNLCISALVFEFKASFCVNNIGEFIADVKGVAANASTIELPFTKTTFSEELKPF